MSEIDDAIKCKHPMHESRLYGALHIWAQRWICAQGTNWVDAWGHDMHVDLATEVYRLMRWAECENSSPDGGPPPYVCCYLPQPDWTPPDFDEYDFDTGETR